MSDYALDLIQRYRQKGILIDTNILLVYFVGSYKRDLVPTFKHTDTFTVEDFDTIAAILDFFTVRVTTPNILTEVSNLSGHLKSRDKGDYFEIFAKGITLLEETYFHSGQVSNHEAFGKFGLTDTALINLAEEKYLVLTDDLPLYHYLVNRRIDALNFNHIRILN